MALSHRLNVLLEDYVVLASILNSSFLMHHFLFNKLLSSFAQIHKVLHVSNYFASGRLVFAEVYLLCFSLLLVYSFITFLLSLLY